MKKQKEENPMKALAEEIFGRVKDKKEFNNILSELFRHGIETVLKSELDEHLGHPRNEESSDTSLALWLEPKDIGVFKSFCF
jgi:hypothetical protein